MSERRGRWGWPAASGCLARPAELGAVDGHDPGGQLLLSDRSTTIVETIFSIPGLGQLIVRAIFDRDYPIIQGVTLAIGILVLLVNLLTDLTYAILDPRVSFE